jgi:hypothetical protein
MIEFITLFLGGLVTESQPVEIMAGDTVAVVEVRLDGELEQRLSAPPWRLRVDFGPELSPHVLEAIALDSEAKELARTRQWVNMSPQPAQSSLVVEGVEQGKGAIARASWESLAESEEPESVEVYFDGQQLPPQNPRSIQLPTFDPDQTHHLRVRLQFTEVLFSEAEAVFGGVYGNEVSTEISAVPIRFEKGSKPKSAQTMEDWFSVGGSPQVIHAVEKGTAEIIVVRDLATEARLEELASQAAHLEKMANQAGGLETGIVLKAHHQISFVSPCPEKQRKGGFRRSVYPHTRSFSSQDGTLLRLLTRVVPENCSEDRQQLADAVAVAGLSASGDGLRRVVILLIDGEPQDYSDRTPAQSIAYLKKMRVPLFIWNLDRSNPLETAWGQATNVRKLGLFGRAFKLVEKTLDHQLIVWLEGLHLPQSIELRPDIEGISLVE